MDLDIGSRPDRGTNRHGLICAGAPFIRLSCPWLVLQVCVLRVSLSSNAFGWSRLPHDHLFGQSFGVSFLALISQPIEPSLYSPYCRAGALPLWHPVQFRAAGPVVRNDVKLPAQVRPPLLSPTRHSPSSPVASVLLLIAAHTSQSPWRVVVCRYVRQTVDILISRFKAEQARKLSAENESGLFPQFGVCTSTRARPT